MIDVIDTKVARDNVAANVTHCMEARGRSLNDIALATNSTIGTIHRLKNGENDSAFTLVARVADEFDTTIDDLMRDPEAFRKDWDAAEKIRNKRRKAIAV